MRNFMTIGIIGAGNIGGVLGKIWNTKGHTVLFGVRNPSSQKAQIVLKQIGNNIRLTAIKEAAEQSEIVVLATPWEAVGEVAFHIADMKEKILIDCTNPIKPNPEWPLAEGMSAAEEIQKRMPGFRVVKAFNTIGAGNFNEPQFGDIPADTFICGNDKNAKSIVAELAKEIGFNVVDVGELKNAELLESMAKLWITLAYQQGIGPNIAFKLLHK
jgi:hypothetical protein